MGNLPKKETECGRMRSDAKYNHNPKNKNNLNHSPKEGRGKTPEIGGKPGFCGKTCGKSVENHVERSIFPQAHRF